MNSGSVVSTSPSNTDAALAQHAMRQTFGVRSDSMVGVERQGAVNWTFRAAAQGRSYAVRVNRIRGSDEAFAEYTRERWCMDAARACGIPTPAVLAISRTGDRAWMIGEWIDGATAPDTPATFHQLGEYAFQLAANSPPRQLRLFPDPFGGWRGQVHYNLAQLTADDPLIGLQVYAPAHQARLREAFEALRTGTFTTALEHGDLAPRNLIVRDNGEAVLIDWGCAAFDVVPLQPVNQLRQRRFETGAPSESCLRAFVEGLRIDWAECVRLEPVLNRWFLLKAMDLVRWAIDRCPERVAESSEMARRVTDAYFSERLALAIPDR